jgi:hypothetical protein
VARVPGTVTEAKLFVSTLCGETETNTLCVEEKVRAEQVGGSV